MTRMQGKRETWQFFFIFRMRIVCHVSDAVYGTNISFSFYQLYVALMIQKCAAWLEPGLCKALEIQSGPVLRT